VIGRQDGIVHGILRGAFTPPEVMRVGHIPITTDISVTVATSGYYLHDMLRQAKEALANADAPLVTRPRHESRPGDSPSPYGRR
jgi:hypothetical protein